jgi:hypothetical protein
VGLQDAATKNYVDQPKPFTGGITISGADSNGMVNFTSVTGSNGLSFIGSDLSWLARHSSAAGPGTPPVPPATLNRLVLNTKPNGSGTDVAIINDDGSASFVSMNATSITSTGTVTGTGLVSKGVAGASSTLAFQGADGAARAAFTTPSDAQGSVTLHVNPFNFDFDNTVGKFTAQGPLYAGAAFLNTNGNITGTIWANLGYNDAYTAIVNRIESRASAFAVAYSNNCVQSNRMAGAIDTEQGIGAATMYEWAGYVLTGYARMDADRYRFRLRQPQLYYPSQGWLVAFPF